MDRHAHSDVVTADYRCSMEVTLLLTHVLPRCHTASMSRVMAVAKPRRRVRTQPAAATAELLAALSYDVSRSHPSGVRLFNPLGGGRATRGKPDTLHEQPRFYTSR